MAKRKKKPKPTRDCYENVANQKKAEERLKRTAAAASRLSAYRQMLIDLTEDAAKNGKNPKVRGLLTDRAFEAERDLRIILKDGIDTLNELRDSGRLETSIREVVEKTRNKDATAEMLKGFSVARKSFKEKFADMDVSFFAEAEKLFRGLKVSTKSDGESITASIINSEGKKQSFVLSPVPLPGHNARVSSTDFFSPAYAGGGVMSARPYFTVDDCHHDQQTMTPKHTAKPIDLYGSIIAGAAVAREMMYRQARLSDEIGFGIVRGEDPITAILVIIAIVGVVLMIAGTVIVIGCVTGAWSGDVCSLGVFLIIAGAILAGGAICVLSGACEFLVAGIVIVAV